MTIKSTDNTLSVVQVAERLGRSEGWVRTQINHGGLPARRLGGLVVIFEPELEEFIANLPKAVRDENA